MGNFDTRELAAVEKQKHRTIEAISVVSSLAFTVLYQLQSDWCWLFAVIGPAGFSYLCYRYNLLAESLLQAFYVIMAIYGFVQRNEEWQIQVWSVPHHLIWLGIGTIGMLCSVLLLKKYTSSSMPVLDSFTTVFSFVGTWIMVNYVHENWLYWIIIDAVSVYMYFKRGLVMGAGLFVIYTLLAVLGYFHILENLLSS